MSEERMKELRSLIKKLREERNNLLKEQRRYSVELYRLKQNKTGGGK